MSGGEGFRDFINTYVCQFGYRLRLAFLFSITFLVMSIIGLFFIESTDSFVIGVMNVVFLGLFTLMFGLILWQCRRVSD